LPAVLPTLLVFSLRRFVQVFVLAALGLGVLTWAQGGSGLAAYAGALGWSAAAAALAASIAAVWAWRRRCRMVFGPPDER
jgi:hypothetical protein